MSDKKAKQALA